MLSVILPTLNEEERLKPTLNSIKCFVDEIVISDGGSIDGTVGYAKSVGASVIIFEKGRGSQLKLGAEVAKGDWLLFLHADTVLADGWFVEATKFMNLGLNKAGVFKFSMDDPRWLARVIEEIVLLRNKLLAMPFGDQGILISRSFYKELGGFKSIPIFEDVDFIRRIGRRRLVFFNSRAATSARRYHKNRLFFQPFKNLLLFILYYLGVSPHFLVRLYK